MIWIWSFESAVKFPHLHCSHVHRSAGAADGECLWEVRDTLLGSTLTPSAAAPAHVTIGGAALSQVDREDVELRRHEHDHTLVVHGRIYCTGVDNPSDERLKIDLGSGGRSALAKICQVKIRQWLYKPEIAAQLGLPSGVQLGPFAQELQRIIPEAVSVAGDLKLDVAVRDASGTLVNEIKDFLVVDYQRLATMTLEATMTQNMSAGSAPSYPPLDL